MDPRFQQTSFIPKKPMVTPQKVKSSAPISVLSLIATIFFIGAVGFAGGTFFYKELVKKQIETARTTLESKKAAYVPDEIEYLIRLDARLTASRQLLQNHIAVTPLFKFLGDITLESVRFRDFVFTYFGPDKIQVEMKGLASNYPSVALQSDLFNEQDALSNTVFSDLAIEGTGLRSFKVVTTINPKLVSYEELINQSQSVDTTGNLEQTAQ